MRLHQVLYALLLSADCHGPLSTLPQQRLVATAETHACAFQGTIRRFKDGRIQKGTLSRDCTVAGHRLPGGSELAFTPSGDLHSCLLGAEAAILAQVLPAKTRLFFLAGGRLRMFWLPAPTLLQGHLVRGPQSDGQGNRLHPNGKLSAIWLAREEVIDGVPCTSEGTWFNRLGTRRMAFFHENGRLRQGHLSRDFSLQGHAFKKGDVISLSPTGAVDPTAEKLD